MHSIPDRSKIFNFFRNVQTVHGDYPAACSMGIGVLVTGVKRPGTWIWPLSSCYCRG